MNERAMANPNLYYGPPAPSEPASSSLADVVTQTAQLLSDARSRLTVLLNQQPMGAEQPKTSNGPSLMSNAFDMRTAAQDIQTLVLQIQERIGISL